jgi:chaperonin cofactor prefoldin
MNEINLKLKSYDELIFEITTLNTNKYLLEQKLNKQKEVLDKIKEYINDYTVFDGSAMCKNDLDKILEEIE